MKQHRRWSFWSEGSAKKAIRSNVSRGLILWVTLFLFLVSNGRGISAATESDLPLSRAQGAVPSGAAITWQVSESLWFGWEQALYDVDAAAPNDIWAVGFYCTYKYGRCGSLIDHWDGTRWSLLSVDSPLDTAILQSVQVLAPNDVWTVGRSGAMPVTAHWDGVNWSVIPSPTVGDAGSLGDISALFPTDIWAVGSYSDGSIWRTLVEHWDGVNWTVVPSPNRGTTGEEDDYLNGVAAIAPNDVWAVGSYGTNHARHAQILHWDGAEWRVAPLPPFPEESSGLSGITSLSATNMWAVGWKRAGPLPEVLILHWDGASWNVVGVKGLCPGGASDITALDANHLWIIGGCSNTDGALFAHWNGHRWTRVASPESTWGVRAITAVSAKELWAVSGYGKIVHGTVPTNAPVTPELESPADRLWTRNPIEFAWQGVDQVAYYRMTVRQGSQKGPRAAKPSKLYYNVYTLKKELQPGKSYRWRVRACNSLGCSPASEWWRFKVDQ